MREAAAGAVWQSGDALRRKAAGVAYLPTEGLAVSLAAHEDGETSEAKLIPALIPRARDLIAGLRLWILDQR